MAANDPRSDQQLVDAINHGDEQAFEAVYWRYRDWVARLARRFVGNDDDALDVLQETFAYFVRKFPGFVLTARLSTFFYPVVKNLAIAHRRKRSRFLGGDGPLEHLADGAHTDYQQAREELAAALARLNEGSREVLLMRFVDGMSLEEIAGALSIPLGTVKSRLHNALETLKTDPAACRYFALNLPPTPRTEQQERTHD